MRMAPVLHVRSISLALALTLLGAPAFAAQRAPAAPEAPPTRGILLRVVQILSPFLEKLGPGMDPLGAPAPQPIPRRAPRRRARSGISVPA